MSKLRLFDTRIITTTLLTATEKMVYLALVEKASNDFICYPKQKTIADELGIGLSTVKKGIAKCKDLGLIKIYRADMRTTNVYVLIPLDWVDSITHNSFVLAEDIYIDTEEELNALREEIIKYYREKTKVVAKRYQNKRKKTKRLSLADRIEDLELTEEAIKDYNSQDLTVVFAKAFYDKYGYYPSINFGRDNTIMKDTFIQSSMSKVLAVNIIQTYVEVYDSKYKSPRFKIPSITNLSNDWIIQDIVDVIKSRLLAVEQDNKKDKIEVVDQVF